MPEGAPRIDRFAADLRRRTEALFGLPEGPGVEGRIAGGIKLHAPHEEARVEFGPALFHCKLEARD